MTITTPQPFRSAIASLLQRELLPTDMTTAELQALEQAVRDRSFFSARTLLTDYLDTAKRTVDEILSPRQVTRDDGSTATEGMDPAAARLRLKQTLQRLGYEPDPDKRGTIEDLSSDARIDLVVKTNTEIAQGYGSWRSGQSDAALDLWPAQELVRLEGRREPRDWRVRWTLAGRASGQPTGWTVTSSGRMIALKNHPIWDRLGDTSMWPDGLGNPWPPFAFGSGMDVRDIGRDEAITLGLIDAATRIQPRRSPFDLPAELVA